MVSSMSLGILEDDAVGEHEVGNAAVGFGVELGVEEAVEGHGEGDEVLLGAVAVGEGECEIES